MYRYRITFNGVVYTLHLNVFDLVAAATQIARDAIFTHYTEVDEVRQVASFSCPFYHVYCNHGHLGNTLLTMYVTVVEVGIVTERPV